MKPRDDDDGGAGGALVGVGLLALGAFVFWRWRQRQDEPATPEYNATGPTGAPVYYAADEIEALGRVITSEADRYTLAERAAIAWTVRNRAAKRKTTIVRLVCSPCGPQGPGRPFASSRPATVENLKLARDVLAAPATADPTGGAGAFFEPAIQDRLVDENKRLIAAGLPPSRPGYKRTSAEVREKWNREGQRQLSTVGRFEFWV